MANLSQLRLLILCLAAVFDCMSASSVAIASDMAHYPARPEMERRSSRFILPENQQAYIETMTGRLSMSGRKIDPFGRGEEMPEQREPVPRKLPLQQALARFKMDAIFPQENRFAAYGRNWDVGASISIKSRGRVYRIQVIAIHPDHVHFRDADTGDKATVRMNMVLPELPHRGFAR